MHSKVLLDGSITDGDARGRLMRPAGLRGRWLAVWMILALLLSVAGHAQVQLPDFGDPASAVISPAEEAEIGKNFMRQVRIHLVVVDDPEVEGYIQSLGYRLVSGGTQGSTSFYFFVVADPVINAFAAPGGYIGIHSGLFTGTESESELASVVSHEIAHVTQRHIVRAIAHSERTGLASLAGMLAAIAIGTQNVQAGAAAAAAASAGTRQSQINFTRANEKEADRVGIQMLASAGYDPRAMPIFFERLQMSTRYYSTPPEFLSTHPVTTNRIADSRGRAEQYPYKQYADSTSYGLVRAKLRVITTKDPARLVADFDAELDQGKKGQRTVLLYGRALALAKAGKRDRAREELRKLVEADPDRVSFRVALAQQELSATNIQEALAIFEDTYGLFPDSKQVVRGYADALLRAGQGQRALDVIDDYSRLYSMDAPLYRLAAEAYRQTGRVMESRMALGEHYYMNGDLRQAIHQLQLATREPVGDYYQRSRAEARLQELQREQQRLSQH